MPDVFGIGTSALTSLQQAITTTGQNIANVNTEGYSRQTVDFTTRTPERNGSYFLGSGTQIANIEREYDRFLTQDVWNRTSSSAYFADLATASGRVDELLGDTTTGIGPALSEFFAAMEAVANSPTTLPERQVFLSEAETLSQRFEYIDTRLSEFQTELNVRITAAVEDVNQFATSIAELNEQISLQAASTNGSASSDLLDLRDQQVKQLSRLVGVTTQTQEDGSLNVFIGKGQPLVVGSTPNSLTAAPNTLQPGKLDVFLVSGTSGGQGNITSLLSDGELGAALDAGSEVIDQARRQIGLLAAGITITFNEIHQQGFDLNGNTGIQMFDPAATEPLINADGSAGLTAAINDISQLTGDNYRLNYTGVDFVLTNLTTRVSEVVVPTPDGTDLVIDKYGLEFRFDATPTAGDTYIVEPTGTSSSKFGLLIDDPSQVAADAGIEEPVGSGINVAAGPGDNRNILELLALQDRGVLVDGATYFDLYTNTSSTVAVQTRRATTLANTEASLLSSAESRQGNLAGVNLEEEAANLIRYQQAYQAAAQVVKTAQEIFDTLIAATD